MEGVTTSLSSLFSYFFIFSCISCISFFSSLIIGVVVVQVFVDLLLHVVVVVDVLLLFVVGRATAIGERP